MPQSSTNDENEQTEITRRFRESSGIILEKMKAESQEKLASWLRLIQSSRHSAQTLESSSTAGAFFESGKEDTPSVAEKNREYQK